VLLSIRLVVVTAWLDRMNASMSAVEANAMDFGPDVIRVALVGGRIISR